VDQQRTDFAIETTGEPAVYWVEIRATGRPNPLVWLRSNPIYVRGAEPPARPAPRPAASVTQPIFDGKTANGWRVEHDPTSVVAVEPAEGIGGTELRFRFGLSGGAPGGQVAALAYDTPNGVASHDRFSFSIRAERPMRISVQLRSGGEPSSRWQRSIYADPSQQEHTVSFDDFVPVGDTRTPRPDLAAIRSVLFVVDANNTKPGTSGRIWVRKAVLEH